MESSSVWEVTDWLRLVDGVVLTPRPLGGWRGGLPRPGLGTESSSFCVDLGGSTLETDRVESVRAMAGRWGGLTGSYAGLSGSIAIGPGVEGVE